MESLSIPPLFRCPISLELMEDPVTLCTGVSYDRKSIERWFQEGHLSCPCTMQALETVDLTPNHTLRRLIQAWSSSNARDRIHKISPMDPDKEKQIEEVFLSIRKAPSNLENLRSLADLAKESKRNRTFIASSDGLSVLASTLCRITTEGEFMCGEEALAILATLPIHKTKEEWVGCLKTSVTVDRIHWFLCRGRFHARLHAAQVLRGLLTSDQNFNFVFRPDKETFQSLALLMLRDADPLSTKTALEILLIISPLKGNRIRAIEGGVAVALIEILPEAKRNIAEKALALSEILCQSAEGRASVCGHPLGIPVLVKNIARVSEIGTDAAIGALWQIAKNCRTSSVIGDMEEAGAYPILFLMLQVGCSSSARERAKEILRIHKSRSTKKNPCSILTRL